MITLWGRNNSTNVKKVLWVLAELELPYEHILAGGQFGLNNEPEYLAMNPNGLVPVLRDDATDSLLWESNTIIRYLAAQYGNGKLWISDPAKRAKAEKWMDWGTSTLAPKHTILLIGLVRTPAEKRDHALIAATIKSCDEILAILDNELSSHSWFSGCDEPGLADIALAPALHNLFNIGIEWTPRPNLERWYKQFGERPTARDIVMIPVV